MTEQRGRPRLPWEVVVPGRPATLHGPASRVAQWQDAVRRAAVDAWQGGPWDGDVAVALAVYDFGPVGELDDKAAATVAALVGVVLGEQRSLPRVKVRGHDLHRPTRFGSPSPALAGALQAAHDREQPFVELVVDAPGPRSDVADGR